MNPLEQYPHLFANGKFKVKIQAPNRMTYNIELFDGSWLMGDMPESATLIARPISDITDEEEQKYRNILDKDGPNPVEFNYWEGLIYLLSIGVYPFDQNHFGETVIDSTTL